MLALSLLIPSMPPASTHQPRPHRLALHDVADPGHVVRLQNLEAILRSELGFLLLFLLGENLCRLVPVDNALHVARQIYGRKDSTRKKRKAVD